MSELEKITITSDEGENIELFVLEQTRLGGISYLLVTDVAEGDGDAMILKDLSQDGDEEAQYVFVEDDAELEAVSGVFSNMLEDIDLQ